MQHDYDAFPNQHSARSIQARFPAQAEIIVHRDHDLLMPMFSAEQACHLQPRPTISLPRVPHNHPVMRDIDTPWDVRKHAEARRPVSFGTLTSSERLLFTHPVPVFAGHVLDMPIKFPGTDVRIPTELATFVPVAQRIIDIEARINPRYDEYYAYLSIHQGMVGNGERQRETPFHVDGFQGPRWTVKHPANHSYLVSDALPTAFYPIGFPLDHLDLSVDDIYAEFARRIEETGSTTWSADDFELILMDCYCVHRGIPASKPTFRTWLRISWETRIFDRLGNAHNPLFDYSWQMVARDTDARIRPATDRLVA